ncbi:MAG TPA: DUF5916 domain-containing protein [Pyrinomonadaceae bacterium]
MKKVLPAAALFALALLISLAPAWQTASAQQVASARTNAPRRAPAGGGAARLLKRMTLSTAETPEGSRVRITSDAALEGVETFTEGGRFFVLVPEADGAVVASGGTSARGFSRVEAGQSGSRRDAALIAFTLAPGFVPRVRASFNRLEIVFAEQSGQQPTSGGSSNKDAAPTPTPTPASPAASPTPTDATASNPAALPGGTRAAAAAATAGTNATRLAALLTPEKVNPVRIPRFEKAPVIDGKMDEEVWQQGALFKDFHQIEPGDNIAPSQPTEVRIGYDSKTLYIAFHCFDDPTKVRATVPKRDNIFEDDFVGAFIDTFNDKRKAYALLWSPLGVQADGIKTTDNEDYSPDIVMESKGSLTSDGYVVEVAIPFKSLRYEAGKDKQWGIHFLRRIQRNNRELDSWMPISRDISGMLNQTGHITGLEGISTERTLELIPSLTLSETGRRVRATPPQPSRGVRGEPPVVDPGRFINPPIEADIGLTAKYSLTPTITLDFAYNPDFAQVEADATVITANQRFPIFFEEKRPFFLEGKEIFETGNQVVHTRAIIDPDFAVKLTGKRGRNTLGLILASDAAPGNFGEDELDERRREIVEEEDDSVRAQRQAAFGDLLTNLVGRNALVGVMRFKRDVGKESSLGFFGTTYNFAERHNHLLGFDGRFKLNPTTVANFEVVGTTLKDCDRNFVNTAAAGAAPDYELQLGCFNRKGFAYSGAYDVTGRHTGWVFSVGGRTRDYVADVGFTRRTDTNNGFFAYRWNTESRPKAKLIQFRIQNFTGVDYDWRGRSQSWFDGTNYNLQFQHQTFVQVGTNFGYTRLFAEEFSGRFAGGDQERQARHRTVFIYAETTLNKQLSGYAFVGTQRGQFDFDFGAGPRFPRVSLSAVQQREAIADGRCEGSVVPEVCLGLHDPGPGKTFDVDAGVTYQPTSALRAQLSFNKSRLTRYDTGLVSFDDNIIVLRTTYQFTRFIAARARIDYDTLESRGRGQFLFGWTPNPGTAFYVGYNDDLTRDGFNPFNGNLEPGLRRNGRTFFIKMSYLFRRSFGE